MAVNSKITLNKDRSKISDAYNVQLNINNGIPEGSTSKNFTQVLSEEQDKVFKFYLDRIKKAKEERDKNRPEFDNLTYEQDYELNKRAGYSYLPPKVNDNEVRIVTGVTEKKVEAVWNELISMNLVPETLAFDEDDNEQVFLGQDIDDIVKRTTQLEKDEDFWDEWLREFLTQRAVFTEEVDEWITTINRGFLKMNEKGGATIGKRHVTVTQRARKKIISGLQIFLGDITIPFYKFQTQPYIIKYYRKSYHQGEAVYGQWKNWKFVKPGKKQTEINPFGYRMYDNLGNDEIEEIHIIDPWKDEYMIMINGVWMFDEPQPCPYIVTPERRYNMDMQAIKGISLDLAYGKCLVASAKTLQGLNSEMIRLLIKKFRLDIDPAMITASNKVFSKDIFMAGAVTNGVKKKDRPELLNPNNQGITSGEFAVYDLIEKKTEQFIGDIRNQQKESGGVPTATQVLNEQKQFIKNLGLSIVGFIRAKRNVHQLRIYNLFENYTRPIKKRHNKLTGKLENVYNTFTNLEGTFENGEIGKKIIPFMGRDVTNLEKRNIFEFEKKEEKAGRPTRIVPINVKRLLDLNLTFYTVVNNKERDGSALNKVLFNEMLIQIGNTVKLTGKQPNPDKITDAFERTWQTKDLFKKGQQQGREEQVSDEFADKNKQINDLIGRSAEGQGVIEGEVGGQNNKSTVNSQVQEG